MPATHFDQPRMIYLILDRESGYTKIGQASDAEKRLKTLLYQDPLLPKPFEFELTMVWQGHIQMEADLHKFFADQRVRGEWFDLSDEDVQLVHESVQAFLDVR